ncbi:MAG: hypothetical protein IIC73_00435 [Armatimonadetes bacterium]|nr:hypothetical protein [Armatimonadota bacterium]
MSKVVQFVWSRRENVLLFTAALAISLALFMQLQVGLVLDQERELEVPLAFANQSDDIIVLQVPNKVKVTATGTQQVLDSLDPSKIQASVDLAGARVGDGRFRVEVTGPIRPGLVLSPVRGFVDMRIEAKVRELLRVELVTFGVPPESFTHDGETILPEFVEVSGLESVVSDVKSVRAVLDLSQILPNKTLEIELEALNEQGRPVPLIKLEPDTVMVSPAVSIGPSMRKLLVTPVFKNQPAFGYRVADYTVTPNLVEVTGNSGTVASVTTVDTDPIDLTGLSADRTFQARLVLPDGMAAAGVTEVTVRVRVRRF